MRYSISRCNHAGRSRRRASLVLGSVIALAWGAGGSSVSASDWETYPWVTLSAGNENDRLLDSGPVPVVVPAGNFIDLRPGILLSRSLGERTRLNLDGVASVEAYDNEDSRKLLGGSFNAELRHRVGSMGRWRLASGANYYADSVEETVDRFRLGAEAAVGLTARRGFIELLVGGQGRRYPNLQTPDDNGTVGTYEELGGSIGANGALRFLKRFEVSGLVTWEKTDARDPIYDNDAIFAQGALRMMLIGPLQIFASALAQTRNYTARVSGQDTDDYRQFGAGAAYLLGRSFDISFRFADARYTDTLDNTDDIQRYAISITWWPGGREVRTITPALAYEIEVEGSGKRIYAGEPHLFRFRAPGAANVSLVGDFNGWDPDANAMTRADDGWWEIRVSLPPGSLQYAYWVDGSPETPPEAETTIDDGFGGRNGLIHVELARP